MSTPQLALILASVSTAEQAADEKQSLLTQERDLRAIADARGWAVVDVLKIPGFSRNYISWEECAQDMLARGITAMADLKRYADQHAFDVFMVRDADRFGRTQSLIMQIAETICIRHRLKIYSQIDNTLVEGEAARFWAAMTGLRSAGEMDKKKLYRERGMERRAERGFHEGLTPWFHRTVHDHETGKPLQVELREDYRYIWDAVFRAIVVERIGFKRVESFLFQQYQIVNPMTGRQFRPHAFYDVLCKNPAAWGHRIRGKRQHERKGVGGLAGDWVYDRDVLPPEGIVLYYDVLPAIYTGQQADDMVAELRRRKDISGGSNPTNPSTFSGLVICDYCDYHMVYTYKAAANWTVYRCPTHERHQQINSGPDCAAKKRSIPYKKLAAWLTPFLEQLLDGQPVEEAFPSPFSTAEQELASVEQQMEATAAEKTRLVERLGLIPDSMLADYQRQMQAVAERADDLTKRYHELRLVAVSQDRGGQIAAIHSLHEAGLDTFWGWDAGRQQQMLKRIFGRWRIVVADGEVVGVAQAGKRPGRQA
jgi:DNA invertase Pin-like site-specific DNA recombinase